MHKFLTTVQRCLAGIAYLFLIFQLTIFGASNRTERINCDFRNSHFLNYRGRQGL